MFWIKLFKNSLFSSLLFSLLYPQFSLAASCCGGGFAVPSLITGDDKAQLTTSYSYSRIDTDVFANGIWQKRTSDDISQVLKIEAAHIFYDRYQAGFSIPVQMRNKQGVQGGSSSNLGDVAGQIGYEYLPDWDYNPWRPRGIGFVSLTLPTGKSIYESPEATGLDSSGRGFWAFGVGTVLTKTWVVWDANASFEMHKAFDKTVHNAQVDGTVKPNLGGSLTLGSGYNIRDLRLGAALSWNYEDGIDVDSIDGSSKGSAQRFAAGTLSAGYMFNSQWSGIMSYADQTLFGSPTNASLSKSITLLVQARWER